MANTINDRDISIIGSAVRLDVTGTNYIYITGNSQIFRVTNTGPSPSSITLTANLVGQLSGTCTFTVISGNATLVTSGNTCTINAADMTSDSLTIRASLAYLGNTYTADYSITEINDFASILLTKDNIVIPTDNNGANGNFTQATTSCTVFVGNNIDTNNWTFATSITPANFITYTGGTGLGSNQITITTMEQLTDTGTITVTATKTGYTTLTKTITVSKAKSGSIGTNGLDGLTFDLTSDSISLPADSAGTVTSFTGATTTAKVYRGASDDTSNWTITAAGTNLTFTFNTTTKTATVTALSADVGYIDFTATRTGFSTLTARYSVTKAKAGLNAKAFNFNLSSQVLSKNKAGTVSPSVITLTANKQNISGTVNWTANPNIVFRNAATGGTAVTSGDTVYIYSSDYGNNTSVSITASVIDSGTTYTDTETILLVNEGADSITLALSNGSVSLSSSSGGTVSSYTGSGTTIKVFEGNTALTYVGTITASSTFTIGTPTVTPAAGITVGARSGTGSVTAVVANHSGMSTSADVVTITYPITVRRSNGSDSTYSLTQTISKSKTGADSTVYYVAPSSSVIQKDVNSNYTPSTITFSSYSATGSAGPVAYLGRFIIATTVDGTTYSNTYTSSTNESSYTYTIPVNVKAIRVRLYQAGGTVTQYDEETIPVVADGLTGYSMQLTNEAVAIGAANDGTISSYVGVESNSYILNGGNDDTENWQFYVSATGGNISYRDSDDTADRTATGMDSGTLGGTNYVSYSDYNASNWSNAFPAGASITTNISDPFGGTSAVRFAMNGTTAALLRVTIPALTVNGSTSYTLSFYCKRVSGSNVALNADLSDGLPATSYNNQLVDNQWVRVTISGIPAAGTKTFIDLVSNNTAIQTLDFCGVQLEPGTTATSITRTNGSIVTGTRGYFKITSLTSDNSWLDITAYSALGYSSLTKRFNVSKAKGGATGAAGAAGINAINIQASPAYLLIPTDSSGNNQNYTNASFTLKVFNGTTDDSANWTFSRINGANITSSISGGTVTVASLTTDVSYIDCTATRTGYSSQNIRVPISKAKAGTNGTNGTNGQRGSVTVYITGQSAWSDTVANTYFTTNYGGKVINDTVTMAGTNFAQTRFWDGTNWIQVTVAIDGNLLVSGTVSAAKLVANTITADKIAAGTITSTEIAASTITANKLAAKTITAASGVIDDLAVNTLQIADYAVTIPDVALTTINNPTGVAVVGASISLTGSKQLVANRPIIIIMTVGTSTNNNSANSRTTLLQYSTDATNWTTLETVNIPPPVLTGSSDVVTYYGDYPPVSLVSGITPAAASNYYFRIYCSSYMFTGRTMLAVIQGKK